MKILYYLLIQTISLSTFAFEENQLHPLFPYGNWEQVKSFKNLTPSIDNKIDFLSEAREGFLVKSKYRLNSKVYYGGNIFSRLLEFSPHVDLGLFPVLYTNVYFDGKIKKESDLDLKHKLMPYYLEELDQFQIGDKGSIEVEGGLSIRIGINSGLFNLGEKFIIDGGYLLTTEKVDNENVIVGLKKIKELGTSQFANATFIYLENGFYKDLTNGISFKINLKSQTGISNYKKIIRGNLADIISDSSIQKIETTSSKKFSHFYGAGVGIPFIPFLNFENYKENSKEDIKVFNYTDDQSNINLTYSLHKKDLSFLDHRFYADAVFLIKDEKEHNQLQYYFIKFDSNSNSQKIQSTKKYLESLISEKSFFDFKQEYNNALGPIEIIFIVNFSNESNKKIMNKIKIDNYELAKKMTLNWNNKEDFNKNFQILKQCGGNIIFEISGKNISRLLKKLEYKYSKDCELD